MKNSKSKMELQFISIVIPSLNGSYAKLLYLTGDEYRNLKKTSTENIGEIGGFFALYSNSNLNHDVLLDEDGWLTRKHFDELLKTNEIQDDLMIRELLINKFKKTCLQEKLH